MHSTDGMTFADVGSSGAFTGFYGVWGSSANDVWVAGGDRSADSGVRTLLHWDGSACPMWNATKEVNAVWDSAPGQYVMVGMEGDESTEAVGSDREIGNGDALYAVSGSSASDVWAVGAGGEALHFDGSTWTATNTGTSLGLYGAVSLSKSDVIAVGAAGTVLRWNGSSWSTIPTSSVINALTNLYGVWSTGDSLWIVGDGGTALRAALWTRASPGDETPRARPAPSPRACARGRGTG